MKNCAFTICTKNYIGLAQVLESSVKKYYSDLDFYVFVADEFCDNKSDLNDNIKIIKELKIISDFEWINFSFKYNLTEFCTTLKPFVFKYLFEEMSYDKICYLDPDILFFSSIKPIYDILDSCLIELTPHFVTFPETDVSKILEDEIKFTGLYNLGFLGLRRHEKVLKILDWWKHNLSDKGFSDTDKAQYTDQKWMDFMTLYFDGNEICINRNIGLNVAPWNFFERKVIKSDTTFFVEYRNQSANKIPIVFVHFSGINYKKLMDERIAEEKTITHKIDYDDVHLLMNEYAQALSSQKEEIEKYWRMEYSYNKYSNGLSIDKHQRRLYNAFYNKHQNKKDNPFDVNSFFYGLLESKRMTINEQNIQTKQGYSENQKSWKSRKMKHLEKIFRCVYMILGYKKYMLFLGFIKRFARVDNQTFLLE